MNSNKTVLITGGAGYIGSIVAEVLIANGYKIIVVDDLSTGNKEAVDSSAIFYEADFSDESFLDWVFDDGIDFVIHLAASAMVSDSVADPCPYYYNNTAKTLKLLHAMVEHGVKNIIFTSTAAVFGEPCYQPIDENHPTNPISPYGQSKLIVEQMLRDFNRAYGIEYVVFRYLNVAGATELHGESRRDETHLIPCVAKKALGDSKPLYVFGDKFPTKDGTGVRDYFHVLDIADAHILAMDKMNEVKGNIFNLGHEEGYSVLEIISEMEKLSGQPIDYQITEARDGDPSMITAKTTKALNMLGWSAKRNLREILKSAYDWQRNRTY